MAETRASARVRMEMEANRKFGPVRAMCAHGPRKALSSGLPVMNLRVKPLLRERRIGDLNPGRCCHLTALAVRYA
jgi:hypothetical protein